MSDVLIALGVSWNGYSDRWRVPRVVVVMMCLCAQQRLLARMSVVVSVRLCVQQKSPRKGCWCA